MLGRLTEEELLSRINGKRTPDAVRALGLLPIPADREERRETILRLDGVDVATDKLVIEQYPTLNVAKLESSSRARRPMNCTATDKSRG